MGMQKAQVYIDAPLTGCLRSPAGKLAVTLKAFVSQGSMGVSAPSFWRQDQPEALPPPPQPSMPSLMSLLPQASTKSLQEPCSCCKRVKVKTQKALPMLLFWKERPQRGGGGQVPAAELLAHQIQGVP